MSLVETVLGINDELFRRIAVRSQMENPEGKLSYARRYLRSERQSTLTQACNAIHYGVRFIEFGS